MSEQPTESSISRGLDIACKRLQWSRETPSAFVRAWATDIAVALDRVREEERERCAKVAMTTPFRAHSADDVDFDSGCVQTRDRIVAAIRALKAVQP